MTGGGHCFHFCSQIKLMDILYILDIVVGRILLVVEGQVSQSENVGGPKNDHGAWPVLDSLQGQETRLDPEIGSSTTGWVTSASETFRLIVWGARGVQGQDSGCWFFRNQEEWIGSGPPPLLIMDVSSLVYPVYVNRCTCTPAPIPHLIETGIVSNGHSSDPILTLITPVKIPSLHMVTFRSPGGYKNSSSTFLQGA